MQSTRRPKGTGQSGGRVALVDLAGGQAKPLQKGEETGWIAKYEATCRPNGGEGKGDENPEQDHEEYGEPKEMKRGGEGSQAWEGRERQPNVQRAHEDGSVAGSG